MFDFVFDSLLLRPPLLRTGPPHWSLILAFQIEVDTSFA